MDRGLKAFLSQRKVEDLCFLQINIFRVTFLIFSAPNKDKDLLFWKYTFQKRVFCSVLLFLGCKGRAEGIFVPKNVEKVVLKINF